MIQEYVFDRNKMAQQTSRRSRWAWYLFELKQMQIRVTIGLYIPLSMNRLIDILDVEFMDDVIEFFAMDTKPYRVETSKICKIVKQKCKKNVRIKYVG